MTEVTDRSRPHATPPGSPRVRLARVALDAALGVPGVAGSDAGPAGLFMTAGGGVRISGVTCVAAARGAYDVALRVRCELVSLPELGTRVTLAVRRAALIAGLAIADLRVDIVDVVEPGSA